MPEVAVLERMPQKTSKHILGHSVSVKYFSFSVPSVLLDYRIFVLIARAEGLSIAFSMLRELL